MLRVIEDSPWIQNDEQALAHGLHVFTPPPIPSPPPELPYYTRGGYVICRVCNLATPYCKGHPRSPGSAAQDGDCDSTLDERIAECQGSK